MDDQTGASPGLTLQELRNATEVLEREAVEAGRLTAEAIAARRPGTGADYPVVSPQSWFAFALWLAAETARGPVAGARSRAQVVHEALADEPATVVLTSGETVRVYAKSLPTLLLLEGLDWDLRQVREELWAVAEAVEAGTIDGAAAVMLVGQVLTARAFREWAWILTHPGPCLPFPEDVVDPPLPEWTGALRAADAERLLLAHLQVNREDLDFLARAFPAERGSSGRLPLSGFLGAQAAEDGLEPKVVITQRSLRSVFAAAVVRSETHRQARRDADAARGSAT